MRKGKEREQKRNIERSQEEFFEAAWCPLFGHVWPLSIYPPNSDERRCLEIIDRGRRLWDVKYPSPICCESIYHPKAEDIPDYPAKRIAAAREISRCYFNVHEYVLLRLNYGPVYKNDGSHETYLALDSEPERIIQAVHKLTLGEEIELVKKVPEYAILAIIAIEEARWALRLAYDDDFDRKEVDESIRSASNIIAHAEKMAAEEVIDQLEKENEDKEKQITEQESFVDTGRKVRKGAEAGGKKIGKKIRDRQTLKHKAWLKMANEIRDENPHRKWKKTELADAVIKRFKAKKKEEFLDSKDTIRRYI